MENQSNYLSLFQEILADQNFERLDKFKDPSVQRKLNQKERSLLARLFVLHGKNLLSKGDNRAQEIFDIATAIDAASAEIYLQQGIVWYQHGIDEQLERPFLIAKQKLEYALKLKVNFSPALHALANVYVKLAANRTDSNYYSKAEKTFEKAEKYLALSDDKLFVFYWDWAICLSEFAKHSGEVFDYLQAAEKFQKASSFGASTDFLLNFGHTLSAIAALTTSTDWFIKAAEIYTQIVEHAPRLFEGWFYLGSTYQTLYSITGSEDFYLKAINAFEAAREIDPQEPELWIKWGYLLLGVSKADWSFDTIEGAINKFERAFELDHCHPQIFCGWGESLLLLGVYKEDLRLIKESEEKILRALELTEETASIIAAHATCLLELGHYFHDEQFYRKAIQRFQQGLSLDNAALSLWQGLSTAYLSLGNLNKDLLALDQAVLAASKAVNLRQTHPQLWVEYGVALLQMGELSGEKHYLAGAIEQFEKALELGLNTETQLGLECLYHLGAAFDFLGDFESDGISYQKSVQVLNYIVSKEPEHYPARYCLAVASSHLGEATNQIEYFYNACEHFVQLSKEDQEDGDLWSEWGLALLNLAYLNQEVDEAKMQFFLEDAEVKLRCAAALGSVHAYYYLGCLYSMKMFYEQAITFMERAESHGVLPSVDELLNDDWLAPLRETDCFKQFICKLSGN